MLEVHEDGSPQGWDAALREQGAVVFHSEAWARHKTHGGAGDALFCIWRDGLDGDVAGRALAIRRPPRGSRAGQLVSKLMFDAPPSTGAAGGDFVAPLAGWARGRRAVVEVGLGTFDAINDWAPAGVPRPRPRTEYVLPPGGGEEDVWGAMRDLARRKVKRASKGGLEGRLANEPSELLAWAEIYRITLERLTRDKGVPETDLNAQRHAGSLATLFDGGHGGLYAAFRDDVMVAGTVFATFGDRAYLIYTGATDAGRDEGAPFLVLFTALQDLRRSGYRHINLGGASGDAAEPDSPDHGLHQFKTRFGATAETRTSGTLLLRPVRAKVIEAVRGLVRR